MEADWRDDEMMAHALAAARTALAAGDYPVGAALVVNGELWGTARNALFSEGRTTAHAEHTLLATHSAQLRTIARGRSDVPIWLYTSLEPCLMCLGIAVLHKVSRIIVACPDPHGGATSLDPRTLGSAYANCWPVITPGPYRRESCDLILAFLQTDRFLNAIEMRRLFQELRAVSS